MRSYGAVAALPKANSGSSAILILALVGAMFPAVVHAGDAPTCFGKPATIVGTSGGDAIQGTDAPDVIVALGGDDVVSAGPGNDRVCAGEGDDSISFGTGLNRIDGGVGSDNIHGGHFSGPVIAYGRRGSDDMSGSPYHSDARDRLYGGPGDDLIDGAIGDRDDASGKDVMWGGPGDDKIAGWGDDDIVWGGAGRDIVWGEDGRYHGGPDRDLMIFYFSVRADIAEGRFRRRTVRPRPSWQAMVDFEDLKGEGDDVFYGDRRRNRLFGYYGSDRLYGRGGNDVLYAGETFDGDNDYLDGGAGKDSCFGGTRQSRCE